MKINFDAVTKQTALHYVPGQCGKAIKSIGWQDSPEMCDDVAIIIIIGGFYQIEENSFLQCAGGLIYKHGGWAFLYLGYSHQAPNLGEGPTRKRSANDFRSS